GEEPLGKYTVRSGYRTLLQGFRIPNTIVNNSGYNIFYKKIWQLNLSGKIKITAWRIFHRLIPNFYNLYNKRLVGSAVCPKCGGGARNLEYGF
ncbi:hypothetical protein Gohar_021263, partial [Gossypium harknessii]|nr:hypothetical protein [Gossypium harknessii]